MRLILALAAALAIGSAARADEPKYYLVDGKVIEKRVSDLESRVADLEKQLAAKTAAPAAPSASGVTCPCVAGCACKGSAASAPSAATEYATVCGPNGCRLVATPSAPAYVTPAGYSAGPYASAPCASGACATGSGSCSTGSCGGGATREFRPVRNFIGAVFGR